MRRVLSGLLIVLFAAGLYGAVPAETDEILDELSKIRLDKTQIYNIRDITIRRDVFAITFTRGTIAFLQPVAGKVTGAIFIGSGDIVGIPPDTPGQVEKQELFRFTGSPILTESFDTAYFRFTDGTYEEILKEYQDRAQEDVTPDEREQLLPFEDELGGAEGALNYRILADFLSSSSHPLFWAQLKNDKYGWFSASYDQRLAEEVSITKTFEATTELGGVWASFNRRAEARDFEAAANEEKSPIDIVNYAIDATIGDSTTLQAKALVRFIPRWDGERVVSFLTSPYVTVSSVTSENGDALTFHQKEGFTDAEVERLGRNHFIVVMPEPMPAGRDIALTIAYSGDVLQQATGDLVYTGDRGVWYPANDTSDRATFDLTFHYPDGFNLVATGVKTGQTQEAGTQHATWRSSDALMAGFAVGDLSFHADASNPLAATVVVSKDAGVVFRDTDPFRPAPPPVAVPVLPAAPPGPRRNRTRDLPPPVAIAPPPPPVNYGVDLSRFGDTMLREVRSNVDFLQGIFGSYPFSTLTATPLAGMTVGFPEGLPSLVTSGSISFLDRDQRARLNIPEEVFGRSERLRSADIARQWVGHSVSWRSYRDQWLFEGLSAYTALMYLENKYKDGRLVLELTRLRSDLQDLSGSVWIGQRVGVRAAALQEGKGAWIMHMLRTQMGDDAFFAMTREFVEQYQGKSATTWDFKRLAEKHMNPAMDLSRDGKLDWFFDAWVFGAPIPTYKLEYKVEPEGSGFAVSGRITQSGVPDDFLMSVPVYADRQLLGRVTVSADEGEFRFASSARPQRVELDVETTVLAVIRR